MNVIPRLRWSNTDRKAIREQLDRILHSVPFQHSRHRQRFLEFIVNETLAGRGVKGYDVALGVFGRPETFDPAIDPVVRVEAGRLREKLREFYEFRRPRRSYSHRFTKGYIHTQNRIPAGK